jgi:hypothetical protein
MGNVSLTDRFEMLDLVREDLLQGQPVQTFGVRERTTGRRLEAHMFPSPDLVSKLDRLSQQKRNSVIDWGSHDRMSYIVTTPLAEGFPQWLTAESEDLESAGAWRIRPANPAPQAPGITPGEFTQMFQLHQAPDPVAGPTSTASIYSISGKVMESAPVSSEPGAFTRAFQRPQPAVSSPAPHESPASGEPGAFTTMFQTPAPVSAQPLSAAPVPVPSVPASQDVAAAAVPKPRISVGLIVVAVLLVLGVAVFLFARKLY